MKIERINDNQIRCTLNKNDLTERHLKISELAYGSENAKELFRDMMEQANIDFGFDADDIPLMIEAIPTSRDSIILVITKVDNPEDFDEKFSRFGITGDSSDMDFDDFDEDSDNYEEDEDEDEEEPEQESGEEESHDTNAKEQDGSASKVVDCFEQLHELIDEAADNKEVSSQSEFIPLGDALQRAKKATIKSQKKKIKENITSKIKVFSFFSLNPIIQVAHIVSPSYSGKNTVWKDTAEKRYYLLLNRDNEKKAFQSVCSVASEFGKEEPITYATQDYYNEHFQIIIKDKALSQLAQL